MPYRIRVDLAEGNYQAHLSVALRTVETDAVKGLDSTVRAYLGGGAHGAFSLSPTIETPVLIPTEVAAASASTLEWRWQAIGLQAGAVHPLIHMLHWAQCRQTCADAIDEIKLHCEPRSARVADTAALQRVPWLIIAGMPGFRYLLRSGREDAKDTLVRVEFVDTVDADVFAGIDGVFLAWDKMVVHGAFMNDLDRDDLCEDPTDALAGRQTYEAAPTIVEHLLYESVGSGFADAALINMLMRFDRPARRIRQVEIE